MKYIVLTAILLTMLFSCSKDEAHLSPDYRLKYVGDYTFIVIREFWMVSYPTQRDTFAYSGTVKLYTIGDEDIDLSPMNFEADSSRRITIHFADYCFITPEVNTDGSFKEAGNFHYFHSGGFISPDLLNFSVTGLGGLGGGTNYYVTGCGDPASMLGQVLVCHPGKENNGLWFRKRLNLKPLIGRIDEEGVTSEK